MAQLTDITKEAKMTKALMDLAIEYLKEDKKTSSLLTKAALDLPDHSKVALYDILMKEMSK